MIVYIIIVIIIKKNKNERKEKEKNILLACFTLYPCILSPTDTVKQHLYICI